MMATISLIWGTNKAAENVTKGTGKVCVGPSGPYRQSVLKIPGMTGPGVFLAL